MPKTDEELLDDLRPVAKSASRRYIGWAQNKQAAVDESDLEQAALIEMHKALPRIREADSPSPYAYGIARHAILSEVQRMTWPKRANSNGSSLVEYFEDTSAGTEDEHIELDKDIAALNTRERFVIRGLEHGYDDNEIALMLGISRTQVRTAKLNAAQKLGLTPMSKKTERVDFRCTPEQKAEWSRAAAEKGVPLSKWMEAALMKALEDQE